MKDFDYAAPMRPVDIQLIGNELALKWDEGGESFIPVETLRRACPCAGCKGEVDVLGQLHKMPDRPLSPAAFELVRFALVGSYAVQLFWKDGHSSGIYSYEYLRQIAQAIG